MSSEVLSLILRAKDEASDAVGKVHQAFGKLGGAAHALGAPFRLAKGAIGGVVDSLFSMGGLLGAGGIVAGLGAAANAATEDEASTARLTAAIAANVKGHRDYSKAIDEAISKGQALAFSDDDTRASLARLVTSTKNVAEAQKLNGIAMDFARLKGIDLATAANIIGKVHDGNVSILTRYGISVAKGTDATAALAQVQAAAADQASTFANTSAGSMDILKDKLHEASEAVGRILIPTMKTLTDFAATTLVPAIGTVIQAVQDWVTDNQPLIDQVEAFVTGTLTDFTSSVGEVIPKVVDLGAKIADIVVPAVILIAGKLRDLIPVAVHVGEVVLDLATRVWEGGLNKAVGAAAKLIGSVIDVIGGIAKAILDNKTVMDGLRTTADLIGTGFGLLADAIGTVLDVLGKLGDAAAPIMNGIAGVVQTAGGAIMAVLGPIVDAMKWVIDNASNILFTKQGAPAAGPGIPTSTPTKKPTYVNPNTPGYVIPGAATGGYVAETGLAVIHKGETVSRAGAGVNFAAGSIVVNGASDPAATAQAVMLAIKRELTRQGVSFSSGY